MLRIITCCLLVTFIVCFPGKIIAQPFGIGDKVPDFSSGQTINYSYQTFHLSSIKKKWVILDFWGTGCASCVMNFAKTDLLQKKFDKDIQFVLVNRQSLDSTVRFFAAKKKVVKPDVPLLTGDSLLESYFPHEAVPFYVLLDENRVVRAFPETDYISEATISSLVETGEALFGANRYIRLNRNVPLLLNLNSSDRNQVESYFFISKELKGYVGTFTEPVEDSNGGIKRITILNRSVEELIRASFNLSPGQFFAKGALINESNRVKQFRRPKDIVEFDSWRKQNLYCLDLLVKPEDTGNGFGILREKLEDHFGLNIIIEKRKIPCIVLQKINGGKELTTLGGKPSSLTETKGEEEVYYWINKPFSDLVDLLQLFFSTHNSDRQFASEVNITGNVDLVLDIGFFNKFQRTNLSVVNDALKSNGLILIEKECEADAIVIRDRKSNGH